MNNTILIVEDELPIVTLLTYNLKQQGFQTDVSFDGEDAIKKITENNYALIILDVMLPKFDGLEICEYIRSQDNEVPILMVTALNEDENIIDGLNSGADDYITKPFSPKVLLARVHALLRRKNRDNNETKENTLQNGTITIYPERFEVYLKNKVLQLTKKEYELLVYFVENKDIVLSRDQLLQAVWDYDIAGDTRIVDVHVGRLREKIEEDKRNPTYIQTIHGFGYKLNKIETSHPTK